MDAFKNAFDPNKNGFNDTISKPAEKVIVNDIGGGINNSIIIPVTNFANDNVLPSSSNNNIIFGAGLNYLTNKYNDGNGNISTASLNRVLDTLKNEFAQPLANGIVNVVGGGFLDTFSVPHLKIFGAYYIDTMFMSLSMSPYGGAEVLMLLSFFGIDAAYVDENAGLEPTYVYKVQTAVTDGVINFLLDPVSGVNGLIDFINNPSLDALGQWAGVFPKTLPSSDITQQDATPTDTPNPLLFYLEAASIVGAVLLYRKFSK